ncbi:hypothetical protein SAMN05444355_10123 [Flavobacterium frigoris]|uniref:Uncharacterized protein n=1 Tax=Flavobacterium frigoris TaxID=229204 RepID=A0A1H9BY88_FLAFI|nr:hypothetical protein SAMN05444355_10123 [Flavobacterium frigoris]
MKPKSVTSHQALTSYLFIFLSTLGLSYSLVNYFLFHKPDTQFLTVMICLFVASIASWQRKKHNKQ